MAAADAGEGGDGVSVAVTVTEKKQGDKHEVKTYLTVQYLYSFKAYYYYNAAACYVIELWFFFHFTSKNVSTSLSSL